MQIDDLRRHSIPEVDSSARLPARRDRDRVLYSDAFRRLGAVTQVALGSPEMSLHNRLTHSLKVEQIGTSIVGYLRSMGIADNGGRIDLNAVAAACLAHDIGHPPFGHAGEQELDSLVVCETHRKSPRTVSQRRTDPCKDCKLEDGFEGNAQTLRVIAILAVHRESKDAPLGLNLTRSTLSATCKYPWTRGCEGKIAHKWGAYDCDKSILEWAIGSDGGSKSLNAQIMDWSDDIAYAVHDIEDFFRIGKIPIDDYKSGSQTLKSFFNYIQSEAVLGEIPLDVIEGFNNLIEYFPTARFGGRTDDLVVLDRLRSRLLTDFVSAVSVEGDLLKINKTSQQLNAILKQLTWYHIIDDPLLTNIQKGQRRVLREIFETLLPDALEAYGRGGNGKEDERALRRLPHALHRAITLGTAQEDSSYTLEQKITRGLLDYISGLSDAEAYHLHSILKGRDFAGHL